MNKVDATNSADGRADFWFGLALVVLGVVVAVESWRMPRLADLNVNPMTIPGLVPGMLGVVIALLGLVLFVRTVRTGSWRTRREVSTNDSPTAFLSDQTKRFLVTLALCVGYAGGLVGSMPFWLATGIFVFLFVFIFEWRKSRTVTQHIMAVVAAALLAIIVAALVTYVFESVFLVRLP